MDYGEFKKEIKNRIKAYLPREYSDWKVELQPAYKVNERLDSLRVMPPESRWKGLNAAVPVFYLQDYFRLHQKGVSVKEILQTIAGYITDCPAPEEVHRAGLNLKQFEDNVVCMVINQKRNKELLKKTPHKKFLNLAVIYRVLAFSKEGLWAGMLVTEDYMKSMGITLDELHERAMKHTLDVMPPVLKDMNEGRSVGAIVGYDDGSFEFRKVNPEDRTPFYMLTNEIMQFGASCMLYTDIMDMAAEQIGGNYYILPGSVHELYLVPEEPESLDFYLKLVADANRDVVEIRDWLSDDVYLYDAEKQRITIAGYGESRGKSETLS